jgi:hypothetical protein
MVPAVSFPHPLGWLWWAFWLSPAARTRSVAHAIVDKAATFFLPIFLLIVSCFRIIIMFEHYFVSEFWSWIETIIHVGKRGRPESIQRRPLRRLGRKGKFAKTI